MNFNDIRISTRLALGFGLMALLIVLIGGVAVYETSRLDADLDVLLEDRYDKIARLNEIKTDVDLIARKMGDSLLMGALMARPDAVKGEIADWQAARKRVTDHLKELEALVTDPKGQEALQAVIAARKVFATLQDDFLHRVESGRDDAHVLLFDKVRPAQMAYFAKVDALVAYQRDQMTAQAAATQASLETARTLTGLVAALAVAIAALLSWWSIRSIMAPLKQAIDVSRAVASGDLSLRVEDGGRNEMGQLLGALRDMQRSLANVVADVRQNADLVATASTQIAQGNNDLSSRTEEQASALQQTAASMKQLSTTVGQNADNAAQGNGLAREASDVAARAGGVVGEVVETMKGINESSRRIADIIGVIDGIAFQTNILALNAAVEAARAGDQGRGFAVVASEVRSLAQRSADAAREIKTLINASVERVEQGSHLVDQAGATMAEVVESIRRVTDLMGEISAASQEQNQGVGQIGDAVHQMDQATQQNAALVEESAAAAASLQTQAQQLVGSVAVFKLGGAEQARALVSAPAAPAANASLLRPSPRRMADAAPAARTGTDDDWQTF